MSHPKQTPFPDAPPEGGLVGLLKHIRQNQTKDEIIQQEINALTAYGSMLIQEKRVKENRVKGKKESYKQRKLYVQQVHAEIKESTGKNPRLKVLVRELEKRYPERPKTNEDAGEKPWKESGVKPWHTALNQGKQF